MTDREMLELAAKACGWENVELQEISGHWTTLWIPDIDTYWAPLDDDGDAFRLSVRLGMDVVHRFASESCEVFKHPFREVLVNHGEEPCAATRLAIVRMAAQIGKAMP